MAPVRVGLLILRLELLLVYRIAISNLRLLSHLVHLISYFLPFGEAYLQTLLMLLLLPLDPLDGLLESDAARLLITLYLLDLCLQFSIHLFLK